MYAADLTPRAGRHRCRCWWHRAGRALGWTVAGAVVLGLGLVPAGLLLAGLLTGR